MTPLTFFDVLMEFVAIDFIPPHGFGQGSCDLMRRFPAKPFQLRSIERVSLVVAGPVGDIRDERERLLERREDELRGFDIREFFVRCHAIMLADDAAFQERDDRRTTIVDMEP